MRSRLLIGGLAALNVALAALVCWLWWEPRGMWSARVVARVNGEPILAEELSSATQIDAHQTGRVDSARIVKGLIAEMTVRQKAARKKDAHEWLQTLKGQFEDEADFQQAVRRAGLSSETLQARLDQTRGTEQWLLDHPKSRPSEEQMRFYYERNKEGFTFPAAVRVQHFAAIFPPSRNPLEVLATTDRIKDAVQHLRDGTPFPQLIDELSNDPAKKVTHGDLGWITRERMEPALADVAFSLPLNTVSPPVATRFGFHLMEVSERREMRAMTFEEARPEIEARLSDDLQRAKMKALVADLVARAKVKILADELR